MSKYSLSVILGFVSFGWFNVTYKLLFELLYVSIYLKPKVEACRSLVDTDICKVVAYIGLWLSELPLTLVSSITFCVVVYALNKYYVKKYLNWALVIGAYSLSYLAYILMGPYGKGNYIFTVFTVLYHALIFGASYKLVFHLTKSST